MTAAVSVLTKVVKLAIKLVKQLAPLLVVEKV